MSAHPMKSWIGDIFADEGAERSLPTLLTDGMFEKAWRFVLDVLTNSDATASSWKKYSLHVSVASHVITPQ